MTRTLPWQKSRTSTLIRSGRPAHSPTPRPKRPRLIEPSSDLENEEREETPRHETLMPKISRTSTSPIRPPEQLTESFMEEGMAKDDMFRMVEDEFLDAAKQFTQHLHAAEYQRMKKAAKSQNAKTISSISRPVTIKMPGETRRKVESVARSKLQAGVLKALYEKEGKASDRDDELDDGPDPWVGTALHSLMGSPRKKAVSLTKIGEAHAATRAAAGFKRSNASKKIANSAPQPSQNLANCSVSKSEATSKTVVEVTESSDEDDDLDAPIPPPRFQNMRVASRALPVTTSRTNAILDTTQLNQNSVTGIATLYTSQAALSSKDLVPFTEPTAVKISLDPADSIPGRESVHNKARIARRLEAAKERKSKEEKGKRRKRLDDIPIFL